VTDDPTEPAPGAPAPPGRGRRPARPPESRARATRAAAPAAARPARARTGGGPVSPVLAVLGAVVVVGGGWWLLRGGDDGGDDGGALPRPPEGEVAVEVDVDLDAPTAVAVTDDVALVQDGPGGIVLALDVESGEERWRAGTAGGTVVVGMGGADDDDGVVGTLEPGESAADHRLVGRDVATGEVRWSTAGADTGPFPVLADDAVHLLTDAGSGMAAVRVVDLASGAERRLADVALGAGGVADASLVVDDGAVVVGTGTGEVVALDPADGGERWRRQLASGARPRVFVDYATGELAGDDGTVVVTDPTGTLAGLAADSGDDRWDPLTPTDGTITIDGVRDGVLLARADELLFAVDLDDGEGLWTEELDGGAAPVGATDDVVVVAGPDAGRVTALTLDRGFRSWRVDLAGVRQALVVDDRVLLAVGAGTDAELQGLDIADGVSRWTSPLDPAATLLAAEATVVAVGGADGAQAWSVGTGEARWALDVGKAGTWVLADRRLLTVAGSDVTVIR
jgi:outer membrane protein assembly factor BamB